MLISFVYIYVYTLTAETDALENIRKNLEVVSKDGILNILVKNSNLTDIQLETLIIDFLSEITYINKVNYELKGLIRPKRVTRGSFHRTLQQAKRNIVSALFTILLLIYLGILDEAALNEFKLLSDRLKEYSHLVNSMISIRSKKSLKEIEEELQNGLKMLIEMKKV